MPATEGNRKSFDIATSTTINDLQVGALDSSGNAIVCTEGVFPAGVAYGDFAGTGASPAGQNSEATLWLGNAPGIKTVRSSGTVSINDWLEPDDGGELRTFTGKGPIVARAVTASAVDAGEFDVYFLGGAGLDVPPGASIIDLDATALTAVAQTHHGKVLRMIHTAAASTVTLPAATGSGMRMTIIVGAVNTNNHVIQVADATDTFEGIVFMANDTDASVSGFESGASDDTITLNGTTTGGAAIGDKLELIDIAKNNWQVTGHVTGTGTEATPFSAAVS